MSWCVTKRRSLNFSVSLSHNNPSVIRPRWYFELRALFVRPPPRCSSPSCEFECSGSLVMHFQLPNHPGHHLQSSFTSHRFLTTGTLGHVCVVTNEFVSCLEFFLDWPFEESSGTLLKWLISWINTKTLLVWWTNVQWKWTPHRQNGTSRWCTKFKWCSLSIFDQIDKESQECEKSSFLLQENYEIQGGQNVTWKPQPIVDFTRSSFWGQFFHFLFIMKR